MILVTAMVIVSQVLCEVVMMTVSGTLEANEAVPDINTWLHRDTDFIFDCC